MRRDVGMLHCARPYDVAIGCSSVQRLTAWAAYWNDRRYERGRVWQRRFTVPDTYGRAWYDRRVAVVSYGQLALNR